MDLKELKQMGGIVSPEPVAKEVTWKRKGDDGKTETLKFKIHVVRYTFADAEKMSELANVEGQSRAAHFISTMLRLGENAEERISYEDAKLLHPGLASVFVEAITQVNESVSKNV